LLLDEPTKGIDVGSKNEIYILMNELAAKGVSIILTSCELSELLEMSDRFVVLASGRIAGELDKTEYIDKEVMRLSTS
jgi:ABC-type sugar transport system ATPase subunit